MEKKFDRSASLRYNTEGQRQERRAKGKKLKSKGLDKSPGGNNANNPKTDVVDPVVGIEPAAISRTAVPRIAAPRTTAQHSEIIFI